ncbi:MAG: hypothetical protein NTY53_05485 [Kiritimatiellaeota bacterium]|nr:hypothetical protein [Kiritimatiellota bacterium]
MKYTHSDVCLWCSLLLLGLLCSRAEIVVAEKPLKGGGHGVTGVAKTNAPSVVVARTEDSLTLLNGDRLQGRLVGVDGSGVLTWQHKAMLEPLRCSTVALDKVELLPRKAEGSRQQQHIVRLVNGDRLCGDVVTLDATQLVLRTWYAGTLNIAHSRLAALSPSAAPTGVLYEGPSADLKGWLVSEDEPTAPALAYRKGALVLPLGRVCGRRIPKLPAMVRFDLELGNWATASFLFSFFCDDPRRMEGDAYNVNFSGGRIEFQRRAGEGEERSLGALDLSEQMAGRKRTHVTILADRQARRFTLLLDGRMAHEFRDTQEFKAKDEHSEYIAFMGMDTASLRIFRVSVAPWDGRVPKAENEDGVPVERDTLVLSNGDNIAGTAQSIAQDSAKFKTAFGELAVPLERIASLRFANKCAPTSGTVRCCFNDQDAVTITLEKLAAETIVGSAEGIGPLKLPLGACTRLEFNPTIKRVAEDDDDL